MVPAAPLSAPIVDFEYTFNLVKNLIKDFKFKDNTAKVVWAYDAITLELVKGSPFSSMVKASNIIGIGRNVISYFIDTFKPEGVK